MEKDHRKSENKGKYGLSAKMMTIMVMSSEGG